jgi:hypothetical protein
LANVKAEDFRSINWLEICHQSVEEFLKLDCLGVEETDLAKGLISWGKYQVLKEGGDLKNLGLLRTKIIPGLKRIRFAAMDQDEFIQLCREEVGALLGKKVRSSILLAITSKKKLAAHQKRKKPPIVFNLPCMQHFNKNKRRDLVTANLIFHVDERAEFIGLKVNTSIAAYGPFKFELYNARNYTVIGSGSSEAKKIAYFGEEYCLIHPKCTLTESNKYNLSFTFPDAFGKVVRPNFPYFTFPLNSFTVNGLTLTIDSTLVHVFVQSMLFVKFP